MNIDYSKNKSLPWIIIVIGGFFQVGWSIGLNYTNGMTDILWDIIVLVSLLLSMLCLSIPMKSGIPMGTAYAIWIGLGVVLTIMVSAALGLEAINIGMVIFMIVTISGVIGLKIVSD